MLHTPPQPLPLDRCPRGCPATGRLKLLTSRTRYYVCDICQVPWSIQRLDVALPAVASSRQDG
jgi:hypothetical protein